MNKTKLLITVAIASLALGHGTVFAAGQARSSECTKPAPIAVVSPTHLPYEYENAVVTLRLVIDAQGVPRSVKPAQWLPPEVASRLVAAVSQWRFSPARVNGEPVATAAILPLKLARAAGA